MPIGMPDWTSDLRVSQGSMIVKRFSGTISSKSPVAVAAINDKGVSLGGWIVFSGSEPDPHLDYFSLTVDAGIIYMTQFDDIWAARIKELGAGAFWVTRYDTVNNYMAVGIPEGISFNEWFLLYYQHYALNNVYPSYWGVIYYTEIT